MNIREKMVLSAFRTSVVISLANMGASFIDGIITSHYLGSSEMAAVGLASPFFSITSALCTCVGTGLVAICAHNLGSGSISTMNKYFNNAVWVMVIVSVLMMAIFLFAAEPVAMALGARGDGSVLLNDSCAYMRGLALGLPTFLISGVIAQTIQMDGGGKLVKISAVACLAADVIFDIIAVFMNWGLFGIGIATSISTVVKFGVLFTHFYGRRTGTIRVEFIKPEFSCIAGMIKSGSDTLTLSAINIIKPILLNTLIISAGGSAALSVLSIYNSLNGFAAVICMGLSSALSITIGIFYGEINKRDIVCTGGFIQKLVLIMYAPVIITLICFSKQIAQYYLPDTSDTRGMLVFALYCLSFCLISYSIISLRIRYLQVMNCVRKAQILTFAANFAVVIICAYAASMTFGAYGIIASNAVSSVICLIGIIVMTQLRNRKIIVTCDDYLCLPEQFYPVKGTYTDIFLKSTDSVETALLSIRNLCEEYAADVGSAGPCEAVDSLPECADKLIHILSAEAEKAGKARPNMDITAEILDSRCRLIIRDDGCRYETGESLFVKALEGIAGAPFTVNAHRVLEFNSLILDMNISSEKKEH